MYALLPMYEQLTRLEINLQTKHPEALARMQPGLSRQEISEITAPYGIELDPDIITLYSWKNGVESATVEGCDWADGYGGFHPHYTFFDLELALRLGKARHNYGVYIYSKAGMIDERFLQAFMCPFGSLGAGQYEQACLYLPCCTLGEIDYPVPLYRECNSGMHDFDLEWKYDSLIDLIDHTNFLYENGDLKIGLDPRVTEVFPAQMRQVILDYNGERVREYRYRNNPYCAQINKAIFTVEWPSSGP
jgi:hypothetical protein